MGSTTIFQHITLEDGLPQNAGLALFQDSRGYLWVGTQDGLARYDGYNFTVFKHDPENPRSLSYNSILCLSEDTQGFLWVGTWGGGLDRYDPRSGDFSSFHNDPSQPGSLSNDTVTAVLPDRRGRIWVGTMGGLDRIDEKTGEFVHYRHDPQDDTTLSSDAISSLLQAEDGTLWVGTGGLSTEGGGLNRFDPQTGRAQRYAHDPEQANSLASDNIAGLDEDATGGLWIATGGYGLTGAGLDRLDPSSGQFTHYRANPDDPTSLPGDDLSAVYVDQDSLVWVGTWNAGLGMLDPAAPGGFVHYRYLPGDPHSLSGDGVWSLYQDRSGVLWIGMLNSGLSKLNPQTLQFGLYRNRPEDADSLTPNLISGFSEDSSGHIWVSTWGGGLERFDPSRGQFSHYRNTPGDPNSLSQDMVSTVYVDRAGLVWAGTLEGGLNRYDPASGRWTLFQHQAGDPDSIADNTSNAMFEDQQGNFWMATFQGLDRYDPHSGKFVHYQNDPANPRSLSENRVISLYLDAQRALWVGTWGGGLNRLDLAQPENWDPTTASFTRYQNQADNDASLSEDSVWVLYGDQSGNLWIGTQGGVNRFDPESGTFQRIREKDGLPNDTIMCMQQDASGELWISTNGGLARFDPQTNLFQVYGELDGLQSDEFDSGACYRSQDGRLYFGGVNGFNAFYPDQVQANPYLPPVVITTFSIFNQPVRTDLSGRQPIQLSYQQNFISFEFAALDFRAPQKNRYAYILEGVDHDWVNAGTRRYASYTDLRGGQYTFRVRGSNNDGIWNGTGVTIPVIVTPPFWDTWWFRGTLALLLVGLLVGGFQLRLRSIRVQQRKLEFQVAERTEELRHEMEQRQKAEQALAEKAAEAAVISERNRLARDLHDAVTQTLFSASLIADVLPDLWQSNQSEAFRRLEELRQLTRGALAEMRTLLVELRPGALTEVPLPDLLRQYCEALIGRARLPIQCRLDGARKLPPDVQLALYRITQEALNNIVKHAHASQVVVVLRMDAVVRLSISDDGVGFDPAAVPGGHLGVKIMCERAEAVGARFSLESEPGEGTQITVVWEDPQMKEIT